MLKPKSIDDAQKKRGLVQPAPLKLKKVTLSLLIGKNQEPELKVRDPLRLTENFIEIIAKISGRVDGTVKGSFPSPFGHFRASAKKRKSSVMLLLSNRAARAHVPPTPPIIRFTNLSLLRVFKQVSPASVTR